MGKKIEWKIHFRLMDYFWAVCSFGARTSTAQSRIFVARPTFANLFTAKCIFKLDIHCRKTNCARIPFNNKETRPYEGASESEKNDHIIAGRSITVEGTWFACSYFFPPLSGEHKDHSESSGHCPISMSYALLAGNSVLTTNKQPGRQNFRSFPNYSLYEWVTFVDCPIYLS